MTYIRVDVQTLQDNIRYRVMGDVEALGRVRKKAVLLGGTPAVWHFNETPVIITQQWQYYMIAINPGMTRQHIAALLDNGRMVCNGDNGFGSDTPKRNYITGSGAGVEDPRYNKAWTMTGAQVEMRDGIVTSFDGKKPPPIKAGKSYPRSVSEIDLSIYVHLPQTSPHMFFNCVNVAADGSIHPFPDGAIYSWTGDNRPRSFLPFISAVPIVYPPKWSENSAWLAKI